LSIPAIELLLRESIGLDAATVGLSSIERAVAERMRACALATVEQYRVHLESSAPELQELTEAVVVPETWFFRDEGAFAALSALAAERLLRRPTAALRALSVPCSTGEEPYSIAMALHDSGLPRKQIAVDAVDISSRALARARRGVYGKNSFRSRDLAFRERHFEATKDGYIIANWLSSAVRFHPGNLVTRRFSFPVEAYDIIFCRNLLIYFDRPTQEAAMRTLGEMLGGEGVLFVGPSETSLAASCGFRAAGDAASFAFRKSIPASAPVVREKNRIAPTPLPRVAPKPVAPALIELCDIAEARRLADDGRFAEAAACCERILVLKPAAEAYYLLGVIHDATGQRERAADCFRRAVYLEPDHSEALAHLALARERQGDHDEARRLRSRAQRASSANQAVRP